MKGEETYDFVRILYIKCQKQKGNQSVQYEVLIRKKELIIKRVSPKPDKCCICEKNIKGDFLHPGRCFSEHRDIAHKICKDCWFKPNGFATEGTNHACPGCVKKMPLSKKIKNVKQPVPENATIIDLT